MTDIIKSLKEHYTVIIFLVVQAIAIVGYAVKLETRVSIMETRGAEYTVDRMNRFDQRITVLEQDIKKNAAQIDRIVDKLTK